MSPFQSVCVGFRPPFSRRTRRGTYLSKIGLQTSRFPDHKAAVSPVHASYIQSKKKNDVVILVGVDVVVIDLVEAVDVALVFFTVHVVVVVVGSAVFAGVGVLTVVVLSC
jgi:hypothetical protein